VTLDLDFLVPLLLVVRVGIDLAAMAGHITSHKLEFFYFVLFAVMAGLLLNADPGNWFGWLSTVIATYSLAAYFVKRAKYAEPAS
jgi:hypothetical protein